MNIGTVRSLLLPAALLAAAPITLRGTEPQTQQSAAGTYHVAICKRAPCTPGDTANVVVSGIMVLSDSAYTLAAFPDTVRFSLLHGESKIASNGCSAMAARTRSPSTYAAIGGMELINWSRKDPNRVAFALHKAYEVDYSTELTLSADGFRGSGKSTPKTNAEPAYPDDIIAGRRAGPPDHKQCADSALVWLRKAKSG